MEAAVAVHEVVHKHLEQCVDQLTKSELEEMEKSKAQVARVERKITGDTASAHAAVQGRAGATHVAHAEIIEDHKRSSEIIGDRERLLGR